MIKIEAMKEYKSGLYRILFVAGVFAVAAIFVPRFIHPMNMINLIRHIFLLCLLGYGMSLSMMIGGLDLSIGSVAALSSVFAATVIATGNVFLGVLTGIAIGGVLGFLNGFMISKFKLPDFIMTFSMMYIARGLALTYTQGQAIYNFPDSFTWLGKGFLWHIPVPAILSLGVLAIMIFLLHKTVFGRGLYAVGAGKEAARYTGINVRKKITQVYALSGLLAGLAGLIFISRLNSASAEMGENWPLEAIAVCVIGGVSFSGGEGKIVGLLLGGVVMAVISNCINLLGIPPRFQDFFTGFVIIVAVAVDHYTKRQEA